MAQSKHSDKALETLRQMNTKPDDWGLTEIIWKRERRKVPTQIKCEECDGTGGAYFKPDGEYVAGMYSLLFAVVLPVRRAANLPAYSSPHFADEYVKEHNLTLQQCRRCPRRRFGWQGTGKVWAMVEREVLIGYVQWAEGTLFDSRFEYSNTNAGTHCALCAKAINFSGRVPVTGKDADGKIHGMWVGEDCARKFLGVKNFKKDHFLDDNLAGAASPETIS